MQARLKRVFQGAALVGLFVGAVPVQASGVGENAGRGASSIVLHLQDLDATSIVATTIDYDMTTRRYQFSGEVSISSRKGFRLNVTGSRVTLVHEGDAGPYRFLIEPLAPERK